MKLISMKEFKAINGSLNSQKFYVHLARVIGEEVITRNVDLGFLSHYLNGDREILSQADDNNRVFIYITTGKDSSNSCLLEADYGYLKVSEMKYTRISNGVNQEGTLVVRNYGTKDNRLVQDSYAIKISDLNAPRATLNYFGNLSDLKKETFSIEVNPVSLSGYGEEAKITDTLSKAKVLSFFKKSHLKGKNKVNGMTINASSEDLISFEQRSRKK